MPPSNNFLGLAPQGVLALTLVVVAQQQQPQQRWW